MQDYVYAKQPHTKIESYFANIKLTNIRSLFTKMCIDANCTLDSRLRISKCNKTEDPMCKKCKVTQSVRVSHVLLE